MSRLQDLSLANFRVFSSASLTDFASINLFYGDNGTGKTSILEAISLLGLGRSFRSHKFKPLIQHEQPQMTVFARLISASGGKVPLGLQRHSDGRVRYKLDGELVQTAVELAKAVPVQVISSDTFSILEGSSKIRRKLLDWQVFHVEHNFYEQWKSVQKCIKHRNSLLRRGKITYSQLAPWDRQLVTATEAITAMRQRQFDILLDRFGALLEDFGVYNSDLSISFYSGWERDKTYQESLEQGFERDSQLGYTYTGAHRADIKIRIGRSSAVDILSRGQQKLVVCALKIAQGLALQQSHTDEQDQSAATASNTGPSIIFLVDDLPAELDSQHRATLAKWLLAMNSQVFITGVERQSLLDAWLNCNDKKVFHVEHGTVKLCDKGSV